MATPHDPSRPLPHDRRLGPSWLVAAKWLVTMVVVAALVWTVYKAIDQWKVSSGEARLTIDDIRSRWLVLAGCFYAIGLIPAALVLHRALRTLGREIPLMQAIAAQLIGHLGKYVPGKAMVILIRSDLLRRGGRGVTLLETAVAIMMETLTLIAIGAAFSLAVITAMDVPAWMKWTAALMSLGAATATMPPLVRWMVQRRMVSRGQLQFSWRSGDVLFAWFWSGVTWWLFGISMTCVAMAIPAGQAIGPVALYLPCFAAVTLAFVAGFVTMLPGGAGVRELVLATLLEPLLGGPEALVLAILARITQVIVESMLATVSWVWIKRY